MFITRFEVCDKKIIIRLKDKVCETSDELLSSDLFKAILEKYLLTLEKRGSKLLNIFKNREVSKETTSILIETLKMLAKMKSDHVLKIVSGSDSFFKDKNQFFNFIENLYNFWRDYDRFIICDSEGDVLHKRPDTTFNNTIEQLTHLIRAVYRDIEENLSGIRPRVYRQVRAGAEVAAIALPINIPFKDESYQKLNEIPVIRQVLLYPPLVLNPPMNKRTGKFEKIQKNPLDVISINKDDFLCYPAKVGKLTILIYFYKKFFELGFSLCNLFELAESTDLLKQPDAVYVYGAPDDSLYQFSSFPTVFYDDLQTNMLSAAIPAKNDFGYFGYLKKMVLTLHNIRIMHENKLPFHGALLKFNLKGDKEVVVLIMGDTGAGKSETLEAFRILGEEYIQDMSIIADDMGSVEIDTGGNVIGYGTEIGAFLRLDDLNPGYPYNHIDRSVIMSPSQVNARLVIPVTSFDTVIKGEQINFVLYANNYEQIDEAHPIIERFENTDAAIKVFKEGAVMSKGTTTSTGLVHSYFANIFGPAQYKETHDVIAQRFFDQFFKKNIFVGQIRTRLGIPGFERKGPEEAAKELLNIIQSSC